jgi:hypothetical protein
LKSQLRIELIKLETKDCFINGIKSRGSLAIDPGVKLKKKVSIRSQLLNVRSSGANLKYPF